MHVEITIYLVRGFYLGVDVLLIQDATELVIRGLGRDVDCAHGKSLVVYCDHLKFIRVMF